MQNKKNYVNVAGRTYSKLMLKMVACLGALGVLACGLSFLCAPEWFHVVRLVGLWSSGFAFTLLWGAYVVSKPTTLDVGVSTISWGAYANWKRSAPNS